MPQIAIIAHAPRVHPASIVYAESEIRTTGYLYHLIRLEVIYEHRRISMTGLVAFGGRKCDSCFFKVVHGCVWLD